MLTQKNWGFEDEIINVEYCGKRMFVKEQYRCSIHKHVKKDEVLMVGSGLVWFESGDSPDTMSGSWMQDNDRIRVKPGTWHRFTALRNTVILEFSTHHEDCDSIRHRQSGKIGADEFRALLSDYYATFNSTQILSPDEARAIASTARTAGRSIGMCNGCFDLMHLGHVELLRQAKARCDVLFVAVNSDDSVRGLKGDSRPFVPEDGRMGMVSSCRYVDYVVRAIGETCLGVVEAIQPNVYVTTTEYGRTGPEGQAVVKAGGVIEVIPMIAGYNTTNIARTVSGKR